MRLPLSFILVCRPSVFYLAFWRVAGKSDTHSVTIKNQDWKGRLLIQLP
jgi:hypothetical protein